MKTRAELYGHEAVGLLRDITMYRVLEKEQLLRLYPGKRGKIENLLAYLTKQGRIFFVDGRYCASLDCAEQTDRGLLAAVWVLIDFIEQVEYHSVSDFPAKIIFFAEGEVYEGYVERRSLNGGSSSTEYKNPDGSSVIVVTFWEEQTCWGVGSEYCKYYRNVWTGI